MHTSPGVSNRFWADLGFLGAELSPILKTQGHPYTFKQDLNTINGTQSIRPNTTDFIRNERLNLPKIRHAIADDPDPTCAQQGHPTTHVTPTHHCDPTNRKPTTTKPERLISPKPHTSHRFPNPELGSGSRHGDSLAWFHPCLLSRTINTQSLRVSLRWRDYACLLS